MMGRRRGVASGQGAEPPNQHGPPTYTQAVPSVDGASAAAAGGCTKHQASCG
jgi:hypothetical protein